MPVGLRILVRLMLIAGACAVLLAVAGAVIHRVGPRYEQRLPAGWLDRLWSLTIVYIAACGLTCFFAYVLRELAFAISRRLSYSIGLAYSIMMWTSPLIGTASGIAAIVWHHERGPGPWVTALTAGFPAFWTMAFVFAAAIMLEPDRTPDFRNNP